jgi:hypothetical protein
VVTAALHLHPWITAAFATCHSLVLMHDDDNSSDGDKLPFVGDPMEVELFKMIGGYFYRTRNYFFIPT